MFQRDRTSLVRSFFCSCLMPAKLREIAVKLIKGELPAFSDDTLAQERLKVCEACPEFAKVSRQCKLCWCFLDLKVKLLEAQCPADKW